LSHEEVVAIVQAAQQLPTARSRLRPATIATLFGLLYVTGMRIGEALMLDIGDLDSGRSLITIRHGKFDKERLIVLHGSTVSALEQYINDPRRPLGTEPCAPLFVSGRRRRLSYPTALANWHACVRKALSGTHPPHSPRPHDLRHTFAVHRVLDWYRAGRDVQDLLPALSIHLGHSTVQNTCAYLKDNGLLLKEALQRFEATTAALDGGHDET
jgi:integrase